MSLQPTVQASSSSPRPRIALLSLALLEDDQEEQNDRLWTRLRLQAQLRRYTRATDALQYLTFNTPTAIIITDSAIMEPRYKFLAIVMRNYAIAGGTVILRCAYYRGMDERKTNFFFNDCFNLPWILGDRKTGSTCLNMEVADKLPLGQQSSESLIISGRLYKPPISAERHLRNSIRQTRQTPMVWTVYGRGSLGYIGATGRYHYTEAMIMAMCGIGLENHSSGDSHSSQLKRHPMETLVSAMRRLSLKDIPIHLMSRQQ
ncbi:hypothetical protein D6D01_01406 [Aureobasidium pullulans]|uniref:Uncharacterized protein n=1 Tax=Aureobasidium pullulans TaxID=5580 RepID=A0A4S9LZB8_AURPU|nr:hypothetical protein D6D01_01406 [Aureobasidium pullulans]